MAGDEAQLVELLLQLRKTTPEQARTILNSQPQIAYALIALMVKHNAVNIQVFTETLASYGGAAAAQAPTVPAIPAAPVAPAAAIPPHVNAPYHHGAPPNLQSGNGYPQPLPPYAQPQPQLQAYPPQPGPGHTAYPPPGGQYPAYGNGQPPPPSAYNDYKGALPPSQGYGVPPAQPAALIPGLPDPLANFPEEQKAMIMRIVSMPVEEIHRLPPAERANVIQVRATLGLPIG